MKHQINEYDLPRCYCHPQIIKLRSLVSRLLLLEKEAYKFFKDHSIAYFIVLGRKLDGEMSRAAFEESFRSYSDDGLTDQSSSDTVGTELTRSSAGTSSSPAQGSSFCLVAALCCALEAECKALETSIYAIPTDNDAIPKSFRDAQPPSCAPGHFCLSDDGFEIVT